MTRKDVRQLLEGQGAAQTSNHVLKAKLIQNGQSAMQTSQNYAQAKALSQQIQQQNGKAEK